MNKSSQYNQQAVPEQCKSEVEDTYLYLSKPGNCPFTSQNTGAM